VAPPAAGLKAALSDTLSLPLVRSARFAAADGLSVRVTWPGLRTVRAAPPTRTRWAFALR
jgi:hypothetical protein